MWQAFGDRRKLSRGVRWRRKSNGLRSVGIGSHRPAWSASPSGDGFGEPWKLRTSGAVGDASITAINRVEVVMAARGTGSSGPDRRTETIEERRKIEARAMKRQRPHVSRRMKTGDWSESSVRRALLNDSRRFGAGSSLFRRVLAHAKILGRQAEKLTERPNIGGIESFVAGEA